MFFIPYTFLLIFCIFLHEGNKIYTKASVNFNRDKQMAINNNTANVKYTPYNEDKSSLAVLYDDYYDINKDEEEKQDQGDDVELVSCANTDLDAQNKIESSENNKKRSISLEELKKLEKMFKSELPDYTFNNINENSINNSVNNNIKRFTRNTDSNIKSINNSNSDIIDRIIYFLKTFKILSKRSPVINPKEDKIKQGDFNISYIEDKDVRNNLSDERCSDYPDSSNMLDNLVQLNYVENDGYSCNTEPKEHANNNTLQHDYSNLDVSNKPDSEFNIPLELMLPQGKPNEDTFNEQSSRRIHRARKDDVIMNLNSSYYESERAFPTTVKSFKVPERKQFNPSVKEDIYNYLLPVIYNFGVKNVTASFKSIIADYLNSNIDEESFRKLLEENLVENVNNLKESASLDRSNRSVITDAENYNENGEGIVKAVIGKAIVKDVTNNTIKSKSDRNSGTFEIRVPLSDNIPEHIPHNWLHETYPQIFNKFDSKLVGKEPYKLDKPTLARENELQKLELDKIKKYNEILQIQLKEEGLRNVNGVHPVQLYKKPNPYNGNYQSTEVQCLLNSSNIDSQLIVEEIPDNLADINQLQSEDRELLDLSNDEYVDSSKQRTNSNDIIEDERNLAKVEDRSSLENAMIDFKDDESSYSPKHTNILKIKDPDLIRNLRKIDSSILSYPPVFDYSQKKINPTTLREVLQTLINASDNKNKHDLNRLITDVTDIKQNRSLIKEMSRIKRFLGYDSALENLNLNEFENVSDNFILVDPKLIKSLNYSVKAVLEPSATTNNELFNYNNDTSEYNNLKIDSLLPKSDSASLKDNNIMLNKQRNVIGKVADSSSSVQKQSKFSDDSNQEKLSFNEKNINDSPQGNLNKFDKNKNFNSRLLYDMTHMKNENSNTDFLNNLFSSDKDMKNFLQNKYSYPNATVKSSPNSSTERNGLPGFNNWSSMFNMIQNQNKYSTPPRKDTFGQLLAGNFSQYNTMKKSPTIKVVGFLLESNNSMSSNNACTSKIDKCNNNRNLDLTDSNNCRTYAVDRIICSPFPEDKNNTGCRNNCNDLCTNSPNQNNSNILSENCTQKLNGCNNDPGNVELLKSLINILQSIFNQQSNTNKGTKKNEFESRC